MNIGLRRHVCTVSKVADQISIFCKQKIRFLCFRL